MEQDEAYCGIGVSTAQWDWGGIYVWHVSPDSELARTDLLSNRPLVQAGDILTHYKDWAGQWQELSEENSIPVLRGPAGSQIELRARRSNPSLFQEYSFETGPITRHRFKGDLENRRDFENPACEILIGDVAPSELMGLAPPSTATATAARERS